MTELKIYFCLINEHGSADFMVFRDLSVVHTFWRAEPRDNVTGLLHVGFIRPKFNEPKELQNYKGKIIATAAAKWTLPGNYKVSRAEILEILLVDSPMPCYLILDGFNYVALEPNGVIYSSCNYQHALPPTALTLAAAALDVLNTERKSLSREEIFALIVERDLYLFTVERPVSFLEAELNRHVVDSDCSDPAINPIFGKTDEGLFFSLDVLPPKLRDWVEQLAYYDEVLLEKLISYGVFDEESYKHRVADLPISISNTVGLFRYRQLQSSIDQSSLEQLLSILPNSLLQRSIYALGLPVRVVNVFNSKSIKTLSDIANLQAEELHLPSLGRKSVSYLCEVILEHVAILAEQSLQRPYDFSENPGCQLQKEQINDSIAEYTLEGASHKPLHEHFSHTLSLLNKREQAIVMARTGYQGKIQTLEEVGKLLNVTRERVRQMQKKFINETIKNELWDDVLIVKIGQLLVDRKVPLILEMLEIEDPWFAGFMGNYLHLAGIIEIFSDSQIHVININGTNFITRIKQDDWRNTVSSFRRTLKDKAEEGSWTRGDITMTFNAGLLEFGASELVPALWDEFSDSLLFDGEDDSSKLLTYGKSAESAIEAVLQQAEKPLHFADVAERATQLMGKIVDDRRAQSVLQNNRAKLYGRGIYGLEKFNPISPRMCDNIRLVVSRLLGNGPLKKQWHSSEILDQLRGQFPALPDELNNYILNIILSHSKELVYLNRMVWARSDSGQNPEDRVDMADAFTKILEKHGTPLKGVDLKDRLKAIRGVSSSLQLHPTERMIQIGPDYWGLIDRDVGGTEEGNLSRLDFLYEHLQVTQKGIHVSEVDACLANCGFEDKDSPTAYALLNLAQRDTRFYLGRAMFLGLSMWGDDTRRLNFAQAVRNIITDMTHPMSIAEISAKVEDLTGLEVDGSVAGILINEGVIYDPSLRLWKAP